MNELRVEVDYVALRQILVALNGAGHEIRELQALRGPLWGDNPIDKLTKEFNDWCAAATATQEASHAPR